MIIIDPAPILTFPLRLLANVIAATRIRKKETEKDGGSGSGPKKADPPGSP